jgi:hypothetical protein
MTSYGFHQLPTGTTFTLATGDGDIQMTSRGSGRKWLDVILNGDNALLLCYYEPYRGDFEKLRKQLDTRGGALEAAATEIRDGMTAVIMLNGVNYPFTIEGVTVD